MLTRQAMFWGAMGGRTRRARKRAVMKLLRSRAWRRREDRAWKKIKRRAIQERQKIVAQSIEFWGIPAAIAA